VIASLLLLLLGQATTLAVDAPVALQPPAGQTAERPVKKPKPDKADKAPKAPKDPNAPKKKKKSDQPAPDETDDPDAEPLIEPGVGFVWKAHPSFRFGENFRLDFEAKLQEDAHGAYANAPGLTCQGVALPTPCTFQLHRNRIGIKGTIFKKIDYEIERELTEQELSDKDLLLGFTPKSQWKDVYLNFKVIKKVQLQVGKFKIPFGLDETTGVSHNDFIYRSLGANYLDPARDIGVMAHAHILKRSLYYDVGVFRHDGDNARSKKIEGGGTTFAARVHGVPLRKVGVPWMNQITVGSAYTYSALSDDPYLPNGLRGRTVLTQDTFFSSVYVKGHRRRWEADADFTKGPASLRAEFTRVTDDRLQQGLGDEDLPAARARAWYVSGTWILTGERKRRPLRSDTELFRGGTGAIELAARYERLWYDSVPGTDTDPASRTPRAYNILESGDRALTLGVNWVLNRFFKLQFNGIREQLDDAVRNPITNGGAFWSRIVRLQIVL
jgi:phosphate-selective porin OprO/OprP